MWLWIIIALLVVVLLCLVRSKKPESRSHNHYNPQTIEKCISKEDIQYQTDYETKQIIATIEKNKTEIERVLKETKKNVNTAWLNSYNNIITISSNLNENLKYHSQRNLEQSKFQYYTSLHFRSMIAADITYKEFLRIHESFDTINNLIVSLAQHNGKTNISKAQIYATKDSLKQLRKIFLNRVHTLNRQTAVLRDKIGRECGIRGKQWRAERLKH